MRKPMHMELLIFILLCSLINAIRVPSCGKTNLSDSVGTIESPHYPKPFESQIQCEWLIHSPKQTLLKLEVLDLDLDEDCSQHWLSVPFEGGRGYNILCGRTFPLDPITVVQPSTYIKYFSSEKKKGSRGFALRYTIENLNCGPSDLHCQSGGCVSNSSRCDGTRDCKDGSDELGCPPGFLCSSGYLSCSSTSNVCYSIAEQTCNGELFCPHGEDELGCTTECPNQISCSSGDGCFDPSQRCNGVRNCRDNSDETDCGIKNCAPLEFICRNGACVSANAICDRNDDCGDMSDEQHCMKSSVLTAATLALFACGCLSCIGLTLLYRFYLAKLRTSSVFMEPLEPEGDIDNGFVYREPPPSYSEAIAETHSLPRMETCRVLARRHRRRIRRCSRSDNRQAAPLQATYKQFVFPTTGLPHEAPASSASASSGRESVTSSTSVEDLLLH